MPARWNVGDKVSFMWNKQRRVGTLKEIIYRDVLDRFGYVSERERHQAVITYSYTDWNNQQKDVDITVRYSALQ